MGLLSLAPGLSAQTSDLDLRLSSGAWLEFNTGLRNLDIQTVAIDPTRPSRMYAGGGGFLYRSLDGGETWAVVERVAQSGQGRRTPEAPQEQVSLTDIDNLTDAQLEEVDARLRELEEELFREVEEEAGEFNATLALEAAQDELLAEALLDVLDDSLQDEAPVLEFSPDPILVPDNRFTQIVIDPAEPGQIFAASGRGVLRSDDFGASWSEYYRGVGDEERRVLALVRTPRLTVLATLGGLYVLEAGETRWRRPVGAPTRDARFVVAAPSAPERLYAIAEARVYRSEDGGETWIPRTIPAGILAHEVGNLAVWPDDPDRVYLATANGVMVSYDAGDRFERTGVVGLVDRAVTWVVVTGDALLAGTRDGVYASRDGGETWRSLQNGLSAALVHQLRVVGEDGPVWAATRQGLFRLMAPGEVTPGDEAARRARESWAYEPNLGQTVQAALLHYGYDEVPVDAWSARIFWSRFLPRATVRYTLQQRRQVQEDFVPDDLGRARRNARNFRTEEDEELRILFRWDIGVLILDRRQVSQRDVHDRQIRRRRDLIRRVIRAYDTRQTLLLRMAEGRRATMSRQLTDHLRLAELTARLDLYTGGFFSAFSAVERP